VEEAVNQGYIREDQDNLVLSTLVYCRDETESGSTAVAEQIVQPDSLAKAIEKPLADKEIESSVVVEEVQPELRKKARAEGVSPGKMLFRERAMEKKIRVDMDELKKDNLEQLKKSKNIQLELLFPEVRKSRPISRDKGNKHNVAVQLPPEFRTGQPWVKDPAVRDREEIREQFNGNNGQKQAGSEDAKGRDNWEGAPAQHPLKDQEARGKPAATSFQEGKEQGKPDRDNGPPKEINEVPAKHPAKNNNGKDNNSGDKFSKKSWENTGNFIPKKLLEDFKHRGIINEEDKKNIYYINGSFPYGAAGSRQRPGHANLEG
jgi:hypothetical protein